MHFNILSILIFSMVFSLHGQEAGSEKMTDDDISSLVEMVDVELNLDRKQEQQLFDILKTSYDQLKEIQATEQTDIEKLYLIRQNQEIADERLRNIFSEEQYAAYRYFVHGDHLSQEGQEASFVYTSRISKLAHDLELKDEKREFFIEILDGLEKQTAQILAGPVNESTGLDLLTAILTSDIELIELIGKSGYESFHKKREAGALSGQASDAESDIATVLMFYDIAQALGLSDLQTESIIRMILEGEMEKQSLRDQYNNSPALLKEKLMRQEQNGLINLQSILTEEQVRKLLDMIGQ